MAVVNGQIRCFDCEALKPVAEFYPSTVAHGAGRCKACAKAAVKAAYARDPERHRAYSRESGRRNPESARATHKRWRDKKLAEFQANPVREGTIRCSTCKCEKHVSEFQASVVAVGFGVCRACKRAAQREYAKRNRAKLNAAKRAWRAKDIERARAVQREYHRRHPEVAFANALRRYGMTPEKYAEMLAAQGGGCACCGSSGNRDGRKLFVDHDHETGAIRGLLCHHCNAGIGHLGDDAEGVRRALAYLEKRRPAHSRPAVRINLMEVNHVGTA